MKRTIIILVLAITTFSSNAQVKIDDFSRIVLNTYISQNIDIPAEAKLALETKLSQIASVNGMAGSASNPRFVITAAVNTGTKDIIAGPPQMIAQNLEVTFFIGDAVDNKIFSSEVLNLKGVGTNETKAFVDAFKNINPKSKDVAAFVEESKNRIISYYSTQCDFILKHANLLSEQFKFEEAIYTLLTVPETCKDCFIKCKDEAAVIFKKKVESDCTEKVKQAKLEWAAEPNENGASKAASILTAIIPSDNCKAEIAKLSEEIKKKLQADQKRKFDFDLLEMQKGYETEQKRLDAIRDIAVEQAKHQPRTISYNHIYWR